MRSLIDPRRERQRAVIRHAVRIWNGGTPRAHNDALAYLARKGFAEQRLEFLAVAQREARRAFLARMPS